jgi:CheY-like chemotaxis protein
MGSSSCASSFATSGSRIVALTANVLAEQRQACLAAGMDDFVQKPVGFADLRAALERSAREIPDEAGGAQAPADRPGGV